MKTSDKRVSINYKNRPTGKYGSVCTIPKFEVDDVQVVVFGYSDDHDVALSGHRTNASIIPGLRRRGKWIQRHDFIRFVRMGFCDNEPDQLVW